MNTFNKSEDELEVDTARKDRLTNIGREQMDTGYAKRQRWEVKQPIVVAHLSISHFTFSILINRMLRYLNSTWGSNLSLF